MSLYTSAMGIISNMQKLDVHSNNISNSSTYGFKNDKETFRVFEENYMRKLEKKENNRIGQYNDKVYVDNIKTNFDQGASHYTNNNNDMMLHDPITHGQTSFFVVERVNQGYEKGSERLLTRNGNFDINPDRQLVTKNGAIVMNENDEPVTIPKDVEHFTVNEDGEIVRGENLEFIDKLKLVSVDKENLGFMEKRFGGFFEVMDLDYIEEKFGPINQIINDFEHDITLQKIFKSKDNLIEIAENREIDILKEFEGEVWHHYVEASNVDMGRELVELMAAQRGVQSNQKTSMIYNKILEKAANEVGR